MRLVFLLLLLANAAAFGYVFYAENRASAAAQIMLLQISPEKVKLLKPKPKKTKRNNKRSCWLQKYCGCVM